MKKQNLRRLGLILTIAAMPVLTGAEGDCGGSTFSMSEAPSMAGDWDVTYDDRLDVSLTIGGAVYERELGAGGGIVEIDHEGQPFMFDLSCDQEAVVCPSEVWPAEVGFRQDDAQYPHRVWLQIPQQSCSGEMVAPAPADCGADTANPECDMICDGEVVTTSQEAFGTIDEAGENWSVALGAGFASNGVNCVLLGASIAQGSLTTSGGAAEESWEASATSGDVITHYAGGCLWAGDVTMDGELEALVLGAQVRFATGFQGVKRYTEVLEYPKELIGLAQAPRSS